jgi:hypothetical protein
MVLTFCLISSLFFFHELNNAFSLIKWFLQYVFNKTFEQKNRNHWAALVFQMDVKFYFWFKKWIKRMLMKFRWSFQSASDYLLKRFSPILEVFNAWGFLFDCTFLIFLHGTFMFFTYICFFVSINVE